MGQELWDYILKGQQLGQVQNSKKGRPWCEHCRKPKHKEDTCWDIHRKPANWKPRQNNKNREYQVSINYRTEKSKESNNAFNAEQMEQFYKMFSSLQSSSHNSTYNPSSLLAHGGNFMRAL